MIIIGIDPSLTSTGLCATRDGIVLSSEAVASKFTGVKRLSDFKEQLIPKVTYVADSDEETMVFIEGYSFGSKNNREVLGELGGVIRLMLFEQEIPFIDVAPTALKKYATGKGNADKIAVAVSVMEDWGKKFPTSDQTDAFVLAMIGRDYIETTKVHPAFRQEVIEGLRNPKVKKKVAKK